MKIERDNEKKIERKKERNKGCARMIQRKREIERAREKQSILQENKIECKPMLDDYWMTNGQKRKTKRNKSEIKTNVVL